MKKVFFVPMLLVMLGWYGCAIFKNNFELKWVKIKNIIDNINMVASRQTQWLSALSGLSG